LNISKGDNFLSPLDIFIVMAEQSQFSKLPKKQLALIAKKLVDEDFPQGNPYGSYDFSNSYNTLENIGKYFSISVVHEDVEFFSKFLEMNDDVLANIFETGDKTLYDKLIIPVAQTYELTYSVWGHCTYDDYMSEIFDTYDMDWVKDSAEQQRNDGSWDLYNGRSLRDTSYDNFEESDYSFDNVKPVSESSIKESLLDRLVLENTSEVVSSLDKQTLLKLKQIIESRLRSL
jgi:hypothetical protein